MKHHTLEAPEPRLYVTDVLSFDPWPFESNALSLDPRTITKAYVEHDQLCRQAPREGGAWSLTRPMCLVTFSDGKTSVVHSTFDLFEILRVTGQQLPD